jgi:hypothetical protein
MMNRKRVIAWIICLFYLVCVNSCSPGHRVLKGKITDRNGEPVDNALVYIETYREGKGTFDFGYAVADTPSAGAFSLTVKWKRNAKTAYAVFAPDMKPVVGFDRIRYYESHDLLFEMDSIAHDKDRCETLLLGMGFPFERNSSLAKRLHKPEYRPLLQAFIRAYEPILDGTCPDLKGNEKKLNAIKNLKQTIGL